MIDLLVCLIIGFTYAFREDLINILGEPPREMKDDLDFSNDINK